MRFFFYGTLRDADVRRLVIGRSADRLDVSPATFAGYTCMAMRARDYPVLRPDEGAVTEGVLVRGVSASEAARLDRFEGAEYRVRTLDVTKPSVRSVAARVYLAARPGLATDVPWRLADWQCRHKRAALRHWSG